MRAISVPLVPGPLLDSDTSFSNPGACLNCCCEPPAKKAIIAHKKSHNALAFRRKQLHLRAVRKKRREGGTLWWITNFINVKKYLEKFTSFSDVRQEAANFEICAGFGKQASHKKPIYLGGIHSCGLGCYVRKVFAWIANGNDFKSICRSSLSQVIIEDTWNELICKRISKWGICWIYERIHFLNHGLSACISDIYLFIYLKDILFEIIASI